jgi:xanthine dehydrogenase accessory factor
MKFGSMSTGRQADVFEHILIGVKGAGDLATGVIHRLRRVGFPVIATELPQPTVIRRTVAFAEAIYAGRVTVEGITGVCVADGAAADAVLNHGEVPVLVDPDAALLLGFQPLALVDAILAKHNTGTRLDDAPVVIALGPGFTAGQDVHAVIETNRGHNLGRVYSSGQAEPDTGVPGAIGGYTGERLLRAPRAGVFRGHFAIGDMVRAGEVVADVDGEPVISAIAGVLRGLLHDGLPVTPGMKVGDVDPRARREHCFTISDKSRAVAGGVLEALLFLLVRNGCV